jgi:hypothetical protein
MINILMQRVAIGVLIATGVWVAMLLVERALVIGLPIWHGLWMAGIVAAAITLIGTIIARIDALRAAVAIDHAAGLKERLSTALEVRRDADPFAQAAVRDAEKTAASVHVPTHVPYRSPQLLPWSVTGILVALILGLFMPSLDLLAGQDGDDPAARQRDADIERENINQDFEVRLNKLKQMAKENPDFAELAKDLEQIKMVDEPTLTPEDVRREKAKQIDKVKDRLAQEKEKGLADAMKDARRMLSRLKPQQGQNPANELSKALAAGDFKGAKKALEKLAEDMKAAAAKGDAQAKQKMAEMQKQLKRLADQLAELDDALYLQKELENKAGLSKEQAEKLAKELAKMDPKQLEKELQRQLGDKGMSEKQIKELAKKIKQQQKAKQSCQNLGQCLAQAAQAMQQCNSPGSAAGAGQAASAALSDAMSQMSEMEMAEAFLSELEAQMAEFQDMRESVCQGGYCRGNMPGRIGPQGPNYGLGIGSRIGKERIAHATQATKVKSKIQGGTIIGQMLVDGPQVKGQASAEAREAVTSAARDAQDAVDRDEVPRQYHGAVRKYFEQLAGLLERASKDKPSDETQSEPQKEPQEDPAQPG